MRRVHNWPAPKWVRLWMLCASRAGDGWLWLSLIAIVYLAGGYRAAVTALLSATFSILLFLVLKRTASRKRPCEFEPHCWANLLPPDQFSFPSGHTMSAFAVAVSLGMYYPWSMAGLLFAAGSIGASRIVLGMHFLSDVVVGGVMGSALAYAVVGMVR
ncbi:MAG TPA: phosphatase PAP2 family protein [Bryobacteraceae bacterium]|nr:phosphatase PAP2 family protein [Bryobacteraceae bacterium]